jgi:N4-gp56 family major capsid protein
MTTTVIAWGDPKAQKKWSTNLAVDVNRKGYFSRKFEGRGDNNVIEEKLEIASDAGDRVSFDLSVQLRQRPTFGDNRVKGKEEQLRFFTDEVIIDQMRHPVSAGGKMTRKRVIHDLRKVAKDRLSDYWRLYLDEIKFVYLSGARGINPEFIEPADYTGFAGNPLQAPDSTHQLYGGAATSKATITTSDVMSRAVAERAIVRVKMMRTTDTDASNMVPVDVDGEAHFILLMSTFQEHQMRNSTASGEWLDIQKALATAEGRNNRIFKGGLGMINNAILHSHENVIRFSDYGASANLPAARALLMGRQAGVIAYGTPGGQRFTWKEEMEDYDNEPTVVAGIIMGLKKTRFNNRDFGVLAIDTYAKDPNT